MNEWTEEGDADLLSFPARARNCPIRPEMAPRGGGWKVEVGGVERTRTLL
jgi:hypothetical protein